MVTDERLARFCWLRITTRGGTLDLKAADYDAARAIAEILTVDTYVSRVEILDPEAQQIHSQLWGHRLEDPGAPR